MRTRHALSAALLAAVITLAGCSSGGDQAEPDPSPTPTELLDLEDLGLDADGGLPPEPVGEARAQYLEQVRGISLVLSEYSLISAGRDACQLQDQGAYDLTGTIADQISGTEAEAEILIAAAEEHICE